MVCQRRLADRYIGVANHLETDNVRSRWVEVLTMAKHRSRQAVHRRRNLSRVWDLVTQRRWTVNFSTLRIYASDCFVSCEGFVLSGLDTGVNTVLETS